MFGTQYMGFALLIAGQGLTAAVPSVPAEDLGMPARVTCHVSTGTFIFTVSEAREEYNRVRGLYNPGTQTYPTRSGYPHEFSNFGGTIKFDDTACNSKKRPVKIYEFPIYQRASEGHEASHYDANKKKDEQPGPGECRVVFTAENGHLCGVMCHKSMTPGGDQAFIKCTA
ncbi:Ribonuclease/ribotoxin [Ilyonectria robusta]|uniref:Ribonuclease/ribotoxin n=1 Tax=Ilyonectria robusta TaxID=1079257 RepID=UPI001E8DE5A0|nr:Ribonuclease/ribotoxin [Ilyonectria robusta]KAH8680439.1 Ribonuclease/ribotoxin [Ilyonectria robusta]